MWPPSDDLITEVARRATGRPDGVVASWDCEPVDHPVQNMTTAALHHVRGALDDGTSWHVVAKVLQPASASPFFASVPEAFRPMVLGALDWEDEPRVYLSGLAGDLPDGLRLPTLHLADDAPERCTLWLEHVTDTGTWDLDGYLTVASALGGLAARWPEDRAADELGFARRELRVLFEGKITHHDIPLLADDATWAAPDVAVAVADDPALRDDLRWLAGHLPERLDRMDRLPHAAAHGDAAPSNLLVDGAGAIVAIDWSYGAIGPVGSDLAQLLAGGVEQGRLGADMVAPVAEVIADGFLEGFGKEGGVQALLDHTTDAVAEATATSLAVRSAFTALIPDGTTPDDGSSRDHLAARARLARHAVDAVRATD